MSQQKTSVPKLRFPYFDSMYDEVDMGKLLTFKNGYNASKDQYGSGTKFINVLDIIENDYINHDRIKGSVNIPEIEFEKNKVEYGDILFQRSSETREEVGQANVYLDRKLPATFGGFVIRGKPKQDFDPVYFNSLLKSSKVRKDITSRSGGSTRYNIGQESLEAICINIAPTLPEQKKIAAFLTSVDNRIDQLKRKQSLLQDYKKGVMQKLFTQELRFKDDDGNPYPDWEEKKLGEVCELVNGLTYSPSDVADEGLLVLRSSNIQDGQVVFNDNVYVSSEVREWNISRPNDILVCVRNGSKRLIGKNAMITQECPKATHGAFMTVLRGAYNQFLFQLLQTDVYKKNVHINLGATINSINGSDLKKFKFMFPSLPEQTRIANFLTTLDRKIDQVTTQITETQTFKKGLLQQMFV